MRYVYLAKSDLDALIQHLKKSHRVIAPVKKENLFILAEVQGAGEIALKYIPTILPPKKYFFPPVEKLGSFKMGDEKMNSVNMETQPTVLFGLHTCDIDGIECLETVFHYHPADPYYKKRRKSLVLIGYECMFPCDEYATCVTMDTHNPKAGYDIMITDAGDKYIIHMNSEIGEKLIGTCLAVSRTGNDADIKFELRRLREEKIKKFKTILDTEYTEIHDLFKQSYKAPAWKDVGKRCVSCGNCTTVCPTCYCFDIQDEVELNMETGERKRIWDSCQLEEFATVAGGENFREERSERQRHRYYRKFCYSIDKYNKFFCTGCGRCTRACVADIKLYETLNQLKKETNNV
ncbi:MAG: 4Fe-4S dicluster domain-containing protein [Candidatus Omnitrophica bacterium]|nr:4Fe-4S dicluster domain-containing protein [Candidatus Omnitrophota bacterium]